MTDRRITAEQASADARFLVTLCETHLRGAVDSAVAPGVVLRAFVTELRRLEWQFKLPTLFGRDGEWLDRYSTVLQAYRELL